MSLNLELVTFEQLEEIANAMRVAYQQYESRKCALFSERQIANTRNQQVLAKQIQSEIDGLKRQQSLLSNAFHTVTGNSLA